MKILVVGMVLLFATAGCRPVQRPADGVTAIPEVEGPPATVAPAPVSTSAAASTELPAIEPQGAVKLVHDPVMAKEGDTYYVFSTGSRIAVICSQDMVNWERCYARV